MDSRVKVESYGLACQNDALLQARTIAQLHGHDNNGTVLVARLVKKNLALFGCAESVSFLQVKHLRVPRIPKEIDIVKDAKDIARLAGFDRLASRRNMHQTSQLSRLGANDGAQNGSLENKRVLFMPANVGRRGSLGAVRVCVGP